MPRKKKYVPLILKKFTNFHCLIDEGDFSCTILMYSTLKIMYSIGTCIQFGLYAYQKLTNPQVTFHESCWNQTCSIIIHKGRGAMFYLILNISLSLSLNVQNDCCSSTISSKLCLKQPSNMAQWMSRLQIGVLPNGSSHQYMSGVPNCRHTYYDTTLFCGNKCLLLLKLLQKIPSSLKFIRVQKYSIC